MFIYLWFSTFATIFSHKMFWHTSHGMKISLLLLVSFLFVLLFSFRYNVGNDFEGYLSLYEYFQTTGKFPRVREPFTHAVFYTIDAFSLPSIFIFFVYSTLTLFFFFVSLKNSASSSIIFFLLMMSGYIFFMNDQIRQALACSIVMYGFGSSRLRFNKRFLFFSLLAVSVHFSAVVIPIVFLASKLIKKKLLNIALPLLGVLIFFVFDRDILVSLLLELFPKIIVDRFMYSDRFLSSAESGGGSVLVWWLVYTVTAVYYFYIKSYNHCYNGIYQVLSVCSIGLFLYFSTFDVFILNRSLVYFIYLMLIPVSHLLNQRVISFGGQGAKIYRAFPVYLVLVLSFFAIFLSYLISDGGRHGGIPYTNYIIEFLHY